jgi:hypothetical protein
MHPICKSAEHTRNEYQKPGLKAKDGTHRAMTCHNCGKERHLVASCNYCNLCKVDGHATRRCPTQRTCWLCQQFGHVKSGCPSRKCFFCGNLGHWEEECPERKITDEITYPPTRMRFRPSAHVRQDLKQEPSVQPSAGATSLANKIGEMNKLVKESDLASGRGWGKKSRGM